MPLDKVSDNEDYALTHYSKVLHSNGNPIACIIDANPDDSKYETILHDPSLKASLTGFLNKHDELGLIFGLKLKIQTDSSFFEYTVYPNEEFIDTVIFNESISIINEKMDNLFLLKKIVTDQFVKTVSEFTKFKKMMP